MALTQLQMVNVCSPMTGDYKSVCRYLVSVYRSDKKMVNLCTKHAPTEYAKLDKSRGPWVKSTEMGDNCGGYPYLKWAAQGFDVP